MLLLCESIILEFQDLKVEVGGMEGEERALFQLQSLEMKEHSTEDPCF